MNGNINECPNCGGTIRLKNAPFRYHGDYIGNFEAFVCSICHHLYFTENAENEIKAVPIELKDFGPFVEL